MSVGKHFSGQVLGTTIDSDQAEFLRNGLSRVLATSDRLSDEECVIILETRNMLLEIINADESNKRVSWMDLFVSLGAGIGIATQNEQPYENIIATLFAVLVMSTASMLAIEAVRNITRHIITTAQRVKLKLSRKNGFFNKWM